MQGEAATTKGYPMLNDRTFDRLFAVWFVFCTLLSLAMLGLIGWAVIELVQWVTTK